MAQMLGTVISPVNIEERQKIDVRPGDVVRIHQKIEEKGKVRTQVFEGTVIARKHGKEAGGTFTVRRTSGAYGIEKIFPLYSPSIDKIEVVSRSKVRRAKLYHIREKATREIKRQMRNRMETPDDFEEAGKAPEETSEAQEAPVPEEVVAKEAPANEGEEKTEDTKEA